MKALNSTLSNKITIKTTGIEGHWQYRIWSNNHIELWWSSAITYNSDRAGTGVQGLYMTSVDIQMPFSVVNAAISASVQWGFAEWVQAQINNKNTVQIRKFGNTNTMDKAQIQMTYIYIIGTLV